MLQIRHPLAAAALLAALLSPLEGAAQTVSPPRTSVRPASGPIGHDPWLVVSSGDRTARANLELLDQALEPYRSTYAGLPSSERALIRQAFADLFPGQRLNRHRLNPFQAQALVYMGLGHWGPADGDCFKGREPRRSRCAATVDSMSRNAAWIHGKALSLGRTGARRPRQEELATLNGMTERSRDILLHAPTCGCRAARDDAEALFAATRDALDAYEASAMPAWMSLGSGRVERIARLSETIERTLLRCLGETQ